MGRVRTLTLAGNTTQARGQAMYDEFSSMAPMRTAEAAAALAAAKEAEETARAARAVADASEAAAAAEAAEAAAPEISASELPVEAEQVAHLPPLLEPTRGPRVPLSETRRTMCRSAWTQGYLG